MIDPIFDHASIEKKLLNFWAEGDWFHPKVDPSKVPFTVLIPPPNVTARLHMGHGLNNTLQDILIRRKRMMGFNALWLPGTDHAGIATQMMVERALEQEGTSRKAMGREAFFERCVEWKEENGGVIIDQLKRLGSSCDWKREAYTMDPKLSRAVRAIFVKLFEDGLIYRGERLVNWDPVLQTAISDDEVESKEIDGNLYSLAYPVKDLPGREVVVATSRPETMFGDTAVAVHPEDERYQDLIGKFVELPFTGRLIPVIADQYVKPEFGTGCVKITPAHDPNDFAMGKRHSLPMRNVLNEDGTMTSDCPEGFRGVDRLEVRKKLIIDLKAMGLFRGVKPYRHVVPHSERSKSPIEPRLSKQWYVKMKPLSGPAVQAVKSGELKLYPDHMAKTYLHWLENIEDWCISRQLWWGHRIPIWYCGGCSEVTTGLEDPTQCKSCGSGSLTQDEDVLDTWFSSWLWPLSPFGWPEKSEELDYFFPTQALVTGAEIIFLWVARMVMVSCYVKGKVPFRDVYFNSIICDKQGRKFSKTLGNGIDPLEVIDQRGADAVRFTCVSLAPLGGRVRMEVGDFDNGSRFITKIWNAARFLLRYTEGRKELTNFKEDELNLPMKWLLGEFSQVAKHVNETLENYQITEAVESLYHFTWGSFCDWGLEAAKLSLESSDENQKESTLSLLFFVFEGLLGLLHPVIPFVTEELWHNLPKHPRRDRPASLAIARYPEGGLGLSAGFLREAEDWKRIAQVISSVRSLRTQATVPPKEKLEGTLLCEPSFAGLIEKAMPWIERLGGLKGLQYGSNPPRPSQSLVATGPGYTLYLPVGAYLDVAKELERLRTEEDRIRKIVKGIEVKLASESFVAKAPREVVESSRAQLENMRSQLTSIQETLTALS